MTSLRVTNKTAYDTGDLTRLFRRGLLAMGIRAPKVIEVLPSHDASSDVHSNSRGIAYIGRCGPRERGACEAKGIVLLLPSPEKLTLRRLARLFQHEVLHNLGKEHGPVADGKGPRTARDMTRSEYWSLGGVPSWAKGMKIRYRGGPDRAYRGTVSGDPEQKRLERALSQLSSPSIRRAGSPMDTYGEGIGYPARGGRGEGRYELRGYTRGSRGKEREVRTYRMREDDPHYMAIELYRMQHSQEGYDPSVRARFEVRDLLNAKRRGNLAPIVTYAELLRRAKAAKAGRSPRGSGRIRFFYIEETPRGPTAVALDYKGASVNLINGDRTETVETIRRAAHKHWPGVPERRRRS